MYEGEYHGEVHGNLLNNDKYYLFRAKCSNLFYWKFKGRVLEFGCGLGQNIFLHKDKSVGFDISGFALEECRKKDIKVEENMKNIKDSSFDGILCCHVCIFRSRDLAV